MKFLALILIFTCYIKVSAQHNSPKAEKPLINTSHFDGWLSVRPNWVSANVRISNDGNYVFYKVFEKWNKSRLIIQSINDKWKLDVPNVKNAVFTEESRKAIFVQANDSLCILTLSSMSTEYISHVNRFKIFQHGNTEWLAYLSATTEKKLVLRNLRNGNEQIFNGVSEYLVSPNGNSLVLTIETKKDSAVIQSLTWVDILNDDRKVFWEGSKAGNLILDSQGMQVAFSVEDTLNDLMVKSIWHYQKETDKAVLLVNNLSVGIDSTLGLERISRFSKDGTKLFIYCKEKNIAKPNPDAVKVDVWSYIDNKLQSQQLRDLSPQSYYGVIHINDRRVILLQQKNDIILNAENDDFLIVNYGWNYLESHWSVPARGISYIVTTSNGKRTLLGMNMTSNLELSTDGKWLIGTDQSFRDIYSYETSTGIIRNITKAVPVPLLKMIERDYWDRPVFAQARGFSFVSWMNDGGILIKDEFDIWQIDPSSNKYPVNLTNGYGRKNKIEFWLAGMYFNKTISTSGEIILNAFSRFNKSNGFYKIVIGRKSNPKLLSMGPYVYDAGYRGASQTKARDAEVYVVMRESAAKSPNYFRTKDFKNFIPISDVYPEKNYNWLTTELFSFKTLDGRTEHAVLYKPENFDPVKKYPVIIHYYERKSQDLNKYFKPAEQNGELDIPWFVSHGYVVLTPDIHFNTGETGKSAFNSIVGAAKFISQFSWVDTKRMGIQGHSFGGYQTNYVVAHTNMFAAAVSSSGPSDFVSLYGSGGNTQYLMEVWQNRMGANLWEKPDLYIKNSPVFRAHKVTTPILTVANHRDVNVLFSQGLEWFTALRRLGKKSWMLQYDEESHGLGGENYKDYVIRMTQFFDHYLKGAPAPRWMTRGIPAKLKGIDNGLELDNEIKTPADGLLAPTERNKINILKKSLSQ